MVRIWRIQNSTQIADISIVRVMVAMTHEKNVEKNQEFRPTKLLETTKLVGGFQPIWKTWVKLDHFPKVRGENKKVCETTTKQSKQLQPFFSNFKNQESLKAGCRNSYLTLILKNIFFGDPESLVLVDFFLVEVHIYIFYILFHLWKFVATVHPRIHEKVNSLSAHFFPRNLHAVCGGTPAEKTEVSTAGKMPSSSSKRQASKGQGAEQIHHANSSCIWVFPKMVGFPHKPMGFSY